MYIIVSRFCSCVAIKKLDFFTPLISSCMDDNIIIHPLLRWTISPGREVGRCIPTNHPAFTGIIPQNNRVSRHPGLMQENPDFLFNSSRSSLAGPTRRGALARARSRCVRVRIGQSAASRDVHSCSQLTMAASSSGYECE